MINPYESPQTAKGQKRPKAFRSKYTIAGLAVLFSAFSVIIDFLERIDPGKSNVPGFLFFVAVPLGSLVAAWLAPNARRLLLMILAMTWGLLGTFAVITTFWSPGTFVWWRVFIPYFVSLPFVLWLATWPINWLSRHRSRADKNQ
ncbi:MAG: hypothetical protein AAFU85_05020 [Planctomycetota bacterium]